MFYLQAQEAAGIVASTVAPLESEDGLHSNSNPGAIVMASNTQASANGSEVVCILHCPASVRVC